MNLRNCLNHKHSGIMLRILSPFYWNAICYRHTLKYLIISKIVFGEAILFNKKWNSNDNGGSYANEFE